MATRLSALTEHGTLRTATAIHVVDDPEISALRVVRDWSTLRQIRRGDLVMLDAGPEQGSWMADAVVRAAWEAYAPVVLIPEHLCLFEGPARLATRYQISLLTMPVEDATALQLDLALAIAARPGPHDLYVEGYLGELVVAPALDDVLHVVGRAVSPARVWIGSDRPAEDADESHTRVEIPNHHDTALWLSSHKEAGSVIEANRLLLDVAVERVSVLLSSVVMRGSGDLPLLENTARQPGARSTARHLLATLLDDRVGLSTLAVWLQTGSVSVTAERLGLHRNTVRTRVARCRARLGLDLDDPDQRLSVALAVWILQH